MEKGEKTGLINGVDNKTVYGGDGTQVDEEPAMEMKAEELEQSRGVLLPTMSYDRTPKGRTTGFIRNNIKMKVIDQDSGKAVETPTTCFGDVEFRGAARRSMSKFLRLSNETSAELIYKLMIRYWKMEEPRLLISVTGGAKSFALEPILKRNFTVGLSRIAETPGCWVISGGTNAGVMKHVGDALQGSNACIGIATWGILSKRDVLQPDPALGKDAFIQSTVPYETGSWLTEKGAFLDNNHSHFLLVDDGSEGKFGVEIPFRGQLEKHIMAKSESVPTVLLVLEGGPGTLGTVQSAVAGDNPVPVVIVKSSGRAADLLVYALTISEEILATHENGEPPSSLDDALHQDLLEQVKDLVGPGRDGGLGSYKMVVECLKYKDSFTISAVGANVDIDDAILEALLNDSNVKPFRQLQLSLVWNRADLAREKIFLQMVEWEGEAVELQWIAIMALAMNNVEFVQLLLEYGISISSFLTNELLEFLYGYRSYDKTSPLRYEFKSKDYTSAERKSVNGTTYRRLVSYESSMDFSHAALPRKAIEDLLDEIVVGLRKIGNEKFIEDLSTRPTEVQGGNLSMMMEAEQSRSKSAIKFEHPFRELFFWAILNNMPDMAKLFWKHGDEAMAKSLIACHICDVLAGRHENHNDIVSSMQDTSAFFRTGGVELLDECYKNDDQSTRTLITSQFNQFNQLDILKVAVDSDNLDFVSHYSVQGLVEDVWTGNMKETGDISLIRVTLAWFIPPLIATFEFKTREEILSSVKSEEDYEEDMEEEMEEDEEDDVDDTDGRVLTKTKSAKEERIEQKDKVERGEGSQLSFCTKLYEFYTNTPIVKFVTHVLAYVAFLLLFSFTAMTRKKQTMPTTIEWIVIVTAFGYLVSEVYQVIQVDAPSIKAMLWDWADSALNIFDAVVLTWFFIALGVMLNDKTRDLGHLLYTIDCGLWWLRLLSILAISPTLGPYLVMITKMMGDLARFMAVLIIVVLAYGVTAAGILKPLDTQHGSINMLIDPIWHPYFNIYGELFANDPPDDGMTRFNTPVYDKYDETVVWVLLGLYLLFTNILLLNLLIAVFNDRYVEVQEKALEIWKFKRYGLIMEYGDRHFLFPPFSLIGHTWILLKWIYKRCRGRKEVNVSGLKSDISNERREELLEFECDCMTKLEKSKLESISKSVEEMASEIITEIDVLKSDMVILKEKVNNPVAAASTGEEG